MDFSKLSSFLDRLTAWRIPGCDCGITIDGTTVYRYASGVRDLEGGEAFRGDELFYLWSCSKPITCVLAMTLLEQGHFLLEDPVEMYLPEFAHCRVREGNGTVPLREPIRIRHLFTMTAGFGYDMNDPAIRAVREATGGRCPTRDVVRAMAEIPLLYQPGDRWNYSICHEILSGLIEVIAGMPTRDYAKKVLFDPLEMHDTGYHLFLDPACRARIPHQYIYRADLDRVLKTADTCGHILGAAYDSGGAGVLSTLQDYLSFASMLARGGIGTNGVRILAPSTVELMRRNFLSPAVLPSFDWPQMVGYGYGLGVRTLLDPARAGTGAPAGEFGWAGAAGAYLLVDPARKLALVYMQHMLESQEPTISPRLRNVLYSCLD